MQQIEEVEDRVTLDPDTVLIALPDPLEFPLCIAFRLKSYDGDQQFAVTVNNMDELRLLATIAIKSKKQAASNSTIPYIDIGVVAKGVNIIESTTIRTGRRYYYDDQG